MITDYQYQASLIEQWFNIIAQEEQKRLICSRRVLKRNNFKVFTGRNLFELGCFCHVGSVTESIRQDIRTVERLPIGYLQSWEQFSSK